MKGQTHRGVRTVWILVLALAAPVAQGAVYSGGMGTAAMPWQIGTVADWGTLRANPDDWDNHFILTADLDFAGASLSPVAPDTDTGTAGFQGVAFTGILDGGGHVLRNAWSTGRTAITWALSGTWVPAAVFNLGLEGIAVTGHRCVGGLVGYVMEGTITGCHTTGDVLRGGEFCRQAGGLVGGNERGTLFSCYATGDVEGWDGTGGLVGYKYDGLVESCRATGTVSGEDDVGGLAGRNSGTLTSCCATGTVYGEDDTGGLAGFNEGTIVSCYARGDVNGAESDIGGLVGENNAGNILGCYSTGVPSSDDDEPEVGGLVGANELGTITASYWDRETSGLIVSAGGAARTTDEMTYPYGADTYTGWDNVYIWAADTDYTINDGYPYLRNCAGPPVEEDGSCGCQSAADKNRALKKFLKRTLGDWLLAGLGLAVLARFAGLRG